MHARPWPYPAGIFTAMATIAVIQHIQPEGPGAIADACAAAGIDIRVVRVDLGDPLPDITDLSGLVVMGGPMSATSDEGFPTRNAEIDLIRQAVDAHIPFLGVCLGAQLLAVAAGGEVHKGHGLEVGWEPVEFLPDAKADPVFSDGPASVEVLHWHGETYTLPPGAISLARSRQYEQQAFRVGPNAWGLQFHIEVDAAAVETFIATFPEDAIHAQGGATGSAGALPMRSPPSKTIATASSAASQTSSQQTDRDAHGHPGCGTSESPPQGSCRICPPPLCGSNLQLVS